ncbi:MAG TPA: TolC family protein [Ferruginibacter sp.]|nr:TolC family protein [Ferruginibacter sp.]
MYRIILLLLLFSFIIHPVSISAQTKQDILPPRATIEDCIAYAQKHNPQIAQALIDEQITAQTIRSKLADWYPQLNVNYNLQHNFQVPTNIIGGNPVALGVNNTSQAQIGLTQSIFNRDVLLAVKSRGDVQLQSTQVTANKKIDLVASVSKAFYDVLASSQQIRVSEQNIIRLERSLQDAFNQYKAGVADKVDYKRTTITLNNVKAARTSGEALLQAKKEYLKYLMGYPDSASLDIAFDSARLETEIQFDTLQQADYKSRIEYRILETQQKLQEASYRYEKNAYLPSVSLNSAYNLNFLNDQFAKLYNTNFPSSFAALSLSIPIYQGGKRKAKIQVAAFQLKRTNKDLESLQLQVRTQYANALAAYKVNLANYQALRENVQLANEVYEVVQLQYKSGIKTYLEVIASETDLRTSQINYFNALYQLLASKIDAQKALGQITAN